MSAQDCDPVPRSATSPGRQEGDRHELPVKTGLFRDLFSEKKHTGDWISIFKSHSHTFVSQVVEVLYCSSPDPVHEELDPARISFLPCGRG